ncbi:DinB family protein [Rufibacter immobilis]|uniref:DinB family protein n=1 Tax=Rufibacter immobilis TaxID=1348778 RepID=A0A3M9MWP9_9BACT|nr:DinB family protein [Rufibacter immobilis]RNI29981.1 DinB family protein [Rufibacter immobilis]
MSEVQTLSVIDVLQKELEAEGQTTRNMLSRVPDDKYDWQPHPKSMTIRALATHIAEMPSWIGMVLNSPELDFATAPYSPKEINSTQELLAYFEQTLAEGKAEFAKAQEESLTEEWTLRNGEIVYLSGSKYDMLRNTMSQIIHHRAQLGVFLRLLNVPIPGSYGPSADEQ